MPIYLPSRTLQHGAHAVGSSLTSPAPAQQPVSQNDDPSGSFTPPYTPSFDSHITPSMAIIMVVLLSAFFLMGFFSVYLKKCTSEPENRTNTPVGAAQSRPPEQGLDPEVVESLPVVIYSVVKTATEGNALTECSVCLNEFKDNEPLRLLPKCKHYFHPECVDMWLYSHTTCPLCRRSLLERFGSFRWPGWGSLRGLRFTRNEDTHGGEPMVATEGREATVYSHNPVVGMDEAGNLSQFGEGGSSVRSWRRGQDLNDVEPGIIHESSILGLPAKFASSFSPYKGRTTYCNELRRSRSTGHSLVKRVLNRASLFLPGSSSSDHPQFGQPLSSCFPLEASARADLRRSRSHAIFSLSLRTEEVPVEDGSSRRWIRSFSFRRAFSLRKSHQEAMASNMGELPSSSGACRTFERLVTDDQ